MMLVKHTEEEPYLGSEELAGFLSWLVWVARAGVCPRLVAWVAGWIPRMWETEETCAATAWS